MKKQTNKTYTILSAALIALALLVCIINAATTVTDHRRYETAVYNLEKGEYLRAAEYFEGLGAYRDSEILGEYARMRAEFDESSRSSICDFYAAIKRIDDLYSGTRFDCEISGDKALISCLYHDMVTSAVD